MSRDAWAAVAATVIVVAVVTLGFHAFGAPHSQRLAQSDLKRVQTLARLALQINQKWRISNHKLPDDLGSLPTSLTQDPINHTDISYRPKSDTQFELCTDFSADNRHPPLQDASGNTSFWLHPAGHYCFGFDVTGFIPPEPYLY